MVKQTADLERLQLLRASNAPVPEFVESAVSCRGWKNASVPKSSVTLFVGSLGSSDGYFSGGRSPGKVVRFCPGHLVALRRQPPSSPTAIRNPAASPRKVFVPGYIGRHDGSSTPATR
jgi:hypothetical protein